MIDALHTLLTCDPWTAAVLVAKTVWRRATGGVAGW